MKLRCQEIKLENGKRVIIGHHTKRKCSVCSKDVITALDNKEWIVIELVGLAKWDIHKCKE